MTCLNPKKISYLHFLWFLHYNFNFSFIRRVCSVCCFVLLKKYYIQIRKHATQCFIVNICSRMSEITSFWISMFTMFTYSIVISWVVSLIYPTLHGEHLITRGSMNVSRFWISRYPSCKHYNQSLLQTSPSHVTSRGGKSSRICFTICHFPGGHTQWARDNFSRPCRRALVKSLKPSLVESNIEMEHPHLSCYRRTNKTIGCSSAL